MKTVDGYIAEYPEATQTRLRALRAHIANMAPHLKQGLKWGKPAFFGDTIAVVYAGYHGHVSLHVTQSTIKALHDKLTGYTLGASSVQFSNDKPLPITLIDTIVDYRLKEYEAGVLWR